VLPETPAEEPASEGETLEPQSDESRGAKLPSQLPCANCGDQVEGFFCRICGQRKTQHRASVRTLLRDAFDDQFSLVTELPRTLRILFTKPGFLTAEYSEGRIARYIAPLRLYLAASVIFFLALSFRMNGNIAGINAQARSARTATPAQLAADSIAQMARDSVGKAARARLAATPDSMLIESRRCAKHSQSRIHFCTPSRTLNEFMAPRLVRLDALTPAELKSRMNEFFLQKTSTVVFLLLPVFALILKALYWRSRKYYAEHFVFSLHVHSFIFFVLSFVILPLPWITRILAGIHVPPKYLLYVLLACLLAIPVYALLAQRRFYRQGWPKTVLKFGVLCAVYFGIVVIAVTAEVTLAMLLI
jgi:hypothetical protein